MISKVPTLATTLFSTTRSNFCSYRTPTFILANSARFPHIIMSVTHPDASNSKKNYHHSTRTPLFLPPVDRTMKSLNRDFFQKGIPMIAIHLENPAYISSFCQKYGNYILKQYGVGHVVFLSTPTTDNVADRAKVSKGILLPERFKTVEQAEKELTGEFKDIREKTKISFVPYTLQLKYDFWRAEEIFAALLPEELLDEIPVGFTIVGHIAHLNVRSQYLPYKSIIGQVILDKNPRIRTVVNKLDSIDTVFRTFDMEVLAGEKEFMVELIESNCRFRFDFSKVYWNSRLHTEHDRLINTFKKGEAVCDVFAGVGPFSVPAGKKGVISFASDLNPQSYKYLVENIARNKVGNFVKPYCEDARTFIKDGVSALYEFAKENPTVSLPPKGRISRSKPAEQQPKPENIKVPFYYSHYVMNLPDSAVEFLDSFIGLYHDENLRKQVFGSDSIEDIKLPTINVHCFHKYDPHLPEPSENEIFEELRKKVSQKIDFEIALDQLSFHAVRKVAPTKTMYCISFKLPLEVALKKPTQEE